MLKGCDAKYFICFRNVGIKFTIKYMHIYVSCRFNQSEKIWELNISTRLKSVLYEVELEMLSTITIGVIGPNFNYDNFNSVVQWCHRGHYRSEEVFVSIWDILHYMVNNFRIILLFHLHVHQQTFVILQLIRIWWW